MINLVRRGPKGWRARDPKGEVRLAQPPKGVKIHYVGARVDPATVKRHAACVELVKGIQRQHMDVNLWADVGYTALVCSHREVFVGRGPGVLPAANGKGLNSDHYAVCALVGDSGLVVPPADMLHGLVDAIEWLRGEGAGRQVKGHRDGYSTSCPGEWLYGWLGRGYPRPDGDVVDEPAPPAWPGRVLEWPPLMKGDDVRQWQARMRRRGWRIDVDGMYGPASEAVCKAFQREKGIKATGRVNRRTWDATWTAPIT
jgi:hypothetical protein